MHRGGKNHAPGGGIAQGGGIFARASRAQDSIFLPPLANFSCTPLRVNILWIEFVIVMQVIPLYKSVICTYKTYCTRKPYYELDTMQRT